MQYFKSYQDFSDYEIEYRLLQLNEGNMSSFLDFIVQKVKKASSDIEVKNIIERVLAKTFEVQKKILPYLVSTFLIISPLRNIVTESNILKEQQKQQIEKLIEEKEKKMEFERISKIAPDFSQKIAEKESSNDWTAYAKDNKNYVGNYIGKYQIGYMALLDTYNQFKPAYYKKLHGSKKEKMKKLIHDFIVIAKDSKLNKTQKTEKLKEIFPENEQEMVMKYVIKNNEHYLRNYKNYIGTEINNVKITWSGMLAAAHLKGAKSVKEYLKSNGKNIPKDYFGTSVEDYMKLF